MKVTPEFEGRLQTWLESCDDKLTGLYYVRLRAINEQAMLKAEAARLTRRAKSYERLERLMNDRAHDILLCRRELGEETSVKTSTYTVWLQPSPGALIAPEDEALYPLEFVQAKTTYVLDKESLKGAIRAGAVFDGFRIDQSEYVRWA